MQNLFGRLELKNLKNNTLANPALNGVWLLEYTTSDSILGRNSKSYKVGPIFQTINAKNLSAENSENVNFFGLVSVPR
jgi:hypothetical protein